MEELVQIQSASSQSANLTTLGRSSISLIPVQAKNHDSLQQKPQIAPSSGNPSASILAVDAASPEPLHP
jgi:hypothetical protein